MPASFGSGVQPPEGLLMARSESLSGWSDADVLERLSDAREEFFNLRFQFATGQLDDSSALRKAKKNVARLLTEKRAREIAAAEALERLESADAG